MKPIVALSLVALLPPLVGCQSTSEAGRNELAAHVGDYAPPPPGLARPRLGIPPVEVGSQASGDMNAQAADQLATLMLRTDRFDVIERGQLRALLEEQDLEGIVEASELARPAEVRGVDYLLLGKVTNLRTKATRTSSRSGVGGFLSYAQDALSDRTVDVDTESVEVQAECGVDLRIVDPSTGVVFDATFSEFQRTDNASAFGLKLDGYGARGEADVDLGDDDRGLIMRLAFDDAIRKMLPGLDRKLSARARTAAVGAGPEGDTAPPAAFCTQCGAQVAGGDAFCAGCGTRVGGGS